MTKLHFRYWSDMNLCWTEKTIYFDDKAEAESYLENIARYDKIAWAKIDGKPIDWI